jgi:hypothetical protein
MKSKKVIAMIAIAAMTASLTAGCGKEEAESPAGNAFDSQPIVTVDDTAPASTDTEPAEEPGLEMPEGCYASELTGLPTPNEIKDQRPIAVMVDNEKTALPHYEVADADIVYEIMNSTNNDRVTRLMCVRKDWKNIKQMGSIRSTRPTNIPLAGEYNAILIHDGGPIYINDYIAKAYCDHLSSGFCRFDNGKSWEYKEYVTAEPTQGVTLNGGTATYDGLIQRISQANISPTYNSYAPKRDTHFILRDYGVDMTPTEMGYKDVKAANEVSIGTFKHTQSTLKYNPETSTYDYYLYGELQKDAEDGEVVTFNNVFLQSCDFHQFDEKGYLVYFYMSEELQEGWYITNGEATKVHWQRQMPDPYLDYDITKFYDENGDEVKINPGKTYISMVPKDGWSTVNIK